MNGYAGKILRLDLTNRRVLTIPTSDYAQWGGGHGMGSAIFFDLVKDKTVGGFDPTNVVTLMTSPLCGTLVPSAGGRTEVQGIGVQSYPIDWFTRSNFGGRFSSQLKYAGWDGVVIEGKASEPVWIDIRNGDVQIRDCSALSLWGKDTQECQKTIWAYVAGNDKYGDWVEPAGKDSLETTQRPAVVAIGPAGENMSRVGCLIHDAGNGSGQGGFGGVLGSKNLKAISAIGTNAIGIHDPKALLKARIWHTKTYGFDKKDPREAHNRFDGGPWPIALFSQGNNWGAKGTPLPPHRPQACVGCHAACRGRYEDGLANEVICENSLFYSAGKSLFIQRTACEMLNRLGINSFELKHSVRYLRALHKSGAFELGTGLECPLDFEDYGSLDFAEQFMKMYAYGNDGRGNPSQFGADMSNGIMRAAEKWGKLDEAPNGTKDLLMTLFPFWGLPVHRDPRSDIIWGYGSVLGDRDINEHGFDSMGRGKPEEAVKILTEKMPPFQDAPLMFDFSDEGIYSEHMAKLLSWHRYYTRFFKQSLLFCDTRWPDLINTRVEGLVGITGEAEPMYLSAVTGKKLTFLEGIELGKTIWNLDHAIWTLQGRHRDMVHFTDIHYDRPGGRTWGLSMKNGKWQRGRMEPRTLDKDRFEDFKTHFYKVQGWDTASGFPTRSTLADMGLDNVADELEAQGKLGTRAAGAKQAVEIGSA